MRFLKYLRFLAIPIALAFSSAANAQIPVTDGAQITTNIANHVESIAKWIQQYKQLEAQLNQAKAHLDAMSGSRGMGNILNDEKLTTLLPENWQNLIQDIKNSDSYKQERSKYPNMPDSPKLNAMFDSQALNNATMADFYKKSQDRVKQVQALMSKIDAASDPAAKQDLANRLVNEQNAIQANQNLLNVLIARQKQEQDIASGDAAKEYACKEFKNC